jgi:hypothetical protein
MATDSDEEFLKGVAESYQEQKQKQKEALSEMGRAEELADYTTVEYGGREIKVKEWLPGRVEDEFKDLATAEQQENPVEVFENIQKVGTVLDELCKDQLYNIEFWEAWHNEYGAAGLMNAFFTLGWPALEGFESKMGTEELEEKVDALGNSQRPTRDNR